MLMKKIVRKLKLLHLLAFKNILVMEGLVLKKRCSVNLGDPHIILLLCVVMSVRK